MEEMTGKQKIVYDLLVKKASSGIPPTVREICAQTGIKSTSQPDRAFRRIRSTSFLWRDYFF